MLEVIPVEAFDDNYIWLLQGEGSRDAVAVDPGDPDPLLETLQARSLQLGTVLITHHHWDHAGGIEDLKTAFPACRFVGPADRRILGLTQIVYDGDLVRLPGLDFQLEVLEVPGHTASHVAYYGGGMLFCGDTLFAAGCGRVFDGTFDQLATSLERIACLPPQTLIYCAHEYTLANLGFARWVEPDNPDIAERQEQTRRKRDGGLPTVPSTLAEELATNPFLRTDQGPVIAAAERNAGRELATRAEVFRTVRQWKDREYD